MRSNLDDGLAVLLIALAACAGCGLVGGMESVALGEWFVMPTDVSTSVSPVLRFDAVAVPLLIVIACVLVLDRDRPAGFAERTNRVALVVLGAAAILVTDLLVLLVIWTVLGMLLASGRDAPCRTQPKEASSCRSSSLVLHLSSVCLLSGLLVCVARYHTTDLHELAIAAAKDGRIDAAHVAAGLSVCLAAAVVIRCGLFPGSLWLRQYLDNSDHSRLSDLLVVTLIPGLALSVRLMVVSASLPDGAVLLAGLGALTTVVVGMIAISQTRIVPTVSLLSVVVAASVCVASLSEDMAAVEAVLPAILVQFSLLAVVLLLSRESQRTRLSRAVLGGSIAVLCSGLAGTNVIANLIRSEAMAAGDVLTFGLPRAQLCNAVWIAFGLGQCLFGFGLVRAVLRERVCPEAEDGEDSTHSSRCGLALAVGVGAILTACLLPESSTHGVIPRCVAFGPATPAALLGAVVAWLLFRSGDPAAASSLPGLESLGRLSRNWFYLDQVWAFGVSLPARIASAFVVAFDRHFISSGREEAWRFSAAGLAAGIEHVRRAGAVYYGLTVAMVVVGLLLVLR